MVSSGSNILWLFSMPNRTKQEWLKFLVFSVSAKEVAGEGEKRWWCVASRVVIVAGFDCGG